MKITNYAKLLVLKKENPVIYLLVPPSRYKSKEGKRARVNLRK